MLGGLPFPPMPHGSCPPLILKCGRAKCGRLRCAPLMMDLMRSMAPFTASLAALMGVMMAFLTELNTDLTLATIGWKPFTALLMAPTAVLMIVATTGQTACATLAIFSNPALTMGHMASMALPMRLVTVSTVSWMSGQMSAMRLPMAPIALSNVA